MFLFSWWSHLSTQTHSWASEFVSECPFLGLAYDQGQVSADKQHGESRQPHRQLSTTLVDKYSPFAPGCLLPWELLVPTINTPKPGHFRDVPGSEVKGEGWRSRSPISAGYLQVVEVGTADTQEGNVGVACLLCASYCPQPHNHTPNIHSQFPPIVSIPRRFSLTLAVSVIL